MWSRGHCGVNVTEPFLQTFCLEIATGHVQTLRGSVISEVLLKGIYESSCINTGLGPFKEMSTLWYLEELATEVCQ